MLPKLPVPVLSLTRVGVRRNIFFESVGEIAGWPDGSSLVTSSTFTTYDISNKQESQNYREKSFFH